MEALMETDFDYLRCPMCGGELIYSEGTHDLCCRRNRPEAGEAAAAAEAEMGEQRQAYTASDDDETQTLCEEREAYGAHSEGGGSAGAMHRGFTPARLPRWGGRALAARGSGRRGSTPRRTDRT